MTVKYEYRCTYYTCIRLSNSPKLLDLLAYVYIRMMDVVRIIGNMNYTQTITQESKMTLFMWETNINGQSCKGRVREF